jgi:hypothetical protein
VPVERIWSTVLALAQLEEMDSCWLVKDVESPEVTIVDQGRRFLEAQSAADRRVKKLLKSGALQAAAARARRAWSAIQDANVKALRETDVVNRFTALTHIQRGSARVVRSMMTDHSTFAAFLDTDGYIMRWQRCAFGTVCASVRRRSPPTLAARRFMILVTLVLSTLLVSIWCVVLRRDRRAASAAHALPFPISSPQVLLQSRRFVLRGDPAHTGVRPRGPVPRLRGRLRGHHPAV